MSIHNYTRKVVNFNIMLIWPISKHKYCMQLFKFQSLIPLSCYTQIDLAFENQY